jgi:HD-GYP domain-containing protein (c-di-GMP phosphodiesterase class II)
MECVEHASTWIARKLNLSEESISNISTAAYFHDFGKLWLPYRPWEIDGPLNAKQYSKMKAHPVLGETKLTGILPDSVLQIIARHHKRHDGSGYPKNLDPCFESSILHVADSLVVMATRNYNGDRDHLFTREESSKELKNLKGSDFHPEIAEVAEELLHEIEYVPYRSVA